MAFVEQFADVEAVDSVLPGSERVSDSGTESERLSCSSIGCRCFLSIYVDVFSITRKRELRGGGESSECRDMLNAST